MEENIIFNERQQEPANVKTEESTVVNAALSPQQTVVSQPNADQNSVQSESSNKANVYCINCGMPLSYEQRFCPNCGSEQYKLQTTITEQPEPKKKSKGKIIGIIIAIVCSVAVLVGGTIAGVVIVSNLKENSNSSESSEEEEYKGPDLQAVYDKIGGDGYYCKLANDGSYISIDTNPLDLDDYSASSAWSMIEELNYELDLPDSLKEKMIHTRALDGRQTATYEYVTVSWTYHPDQGLEVTYELNEFEAKDNDSDDDDNGGYAFY